MVTGWIVEVKDIDVPWKNAALPKWIEQFRQLSYRGVQMSVVAAAGTKLDRVMTAMLMPTARGLRVIIPYSNFGECPAAVGRHHGMSLTGLYDMVGNVREWCFNAVDDSGDKRYIFGGDWTDPEHMFWLRNVTSP